MKFYFVSASSAFLSIINFSFAQKDSTPFWFFLVKIICPATFMLRALSSESRLITRILEMVVAIGGDKADLHLVGGEENSC
jgi:hypothetical protein